MDSPSTRYVGRRGKSLAYQVIGDGPRAVVSMMDVNCHLDLLWTDVVWVEQCRRQGGLCRLVVLQQLGVGLSDRLDRVPTLEEQASDIGAVMDAEGITSATLYGLSTAGMAVTLFAAQFPERVDAVVLWSPLAQGWRHEGPEHTAGLTPEEAVTMRAAWDGVVAHWGEGRTIDIWNPVVAARSRPVVAMLERTSASPAAAAALYEAAMRSDVREVLPLVRAPTRVLHHPEYLMPQGPARLVAAEIPDATFHELPPSAPHMSMSETTIPVWDHLVEVVSGRPMAGRTDRELATIVFTDVVSSTELVVRHGDAEWSDLLRRHKHQIRQTVEQAGGELVQLLGDGSLSVFAGPAAAIRAARGIGEQARTLGLETRAGAHTGECERRSGDVAGLAVHIAARVAAAAAPGEVWVSRTVRDLVGGSGLVLAPRGVHELKGVPDRWELFGLSEHETDVHVDDDPQAMRPTDRFAIAGARRAPRLMQAATRLDNARHRRRRKRADRS